MCLQATLFPGDFSQPKLGSVRLDLDNMKGAYGTTELSISGWPSTSGLATRRTKHVLLENDTRADEELRLPQTLTPMLAGRGPRQLSCGDLRVHEEFQQLLNLP
jgi:hypothetical protein